MSTEFVKFGSLFEKKKKLSLKTHFLLGWVFVAVLFGLLFYYINRQTYRYHLEKKDEILQLSNVMVASLMNEVMEEVASKTLAVGRNLLKSKAHGQDSTREQIAALADTPSFHSIYIKDYNWVPGNSFEALNRKELIKRNHLTKNGKLLQIINNPKNVHLFNLINEGGNNRALLARAFKEKGKLKGVLIASLELGRLESKIGELLSKHHVEYSLLNESYQPVLGNNIFQANCLKELQSFSNNRPDQRELVKIPNSHYQCGNDSYTYLSHLPDYPIFVLVSLSKRINELEYKNLISRQVIYLFSGVLILSVIAYYIFFKLVLPTIKLAEMAEEIAKGKETSEFVSNFYEYQLLADQLKTIASLKSELTNCQQKFLTAYCGLVLFIEHHCHGLKHALELKNSFLKNLGQEISGPVQGINTFVESLKDNWQGWSNETKLELVSKCQRAANRLLNLVRNILDFSKLEQTKQKIIRERVNILSLIKQVMTEFNDSDSNNFSRIKFINHTSSSIVEASVDGSRLAQVIYNLISNALKYSKDEVEVVVSLAKSSSRGKEELRITVSDYGIGVPDSEGENIFLPFYQGVRRSNKEEGGLGLSISKQIIQLHKGKIWVEPNNPGSKFIISLPVDDYLQLVMPKIIKIEEDNVLTKQASIVMIDDEIICLETVKLLLGGSDFDVAYFEHAEKGYDHIINNAATIDLVLLDIMMPGINGIEIMQKMAADSATKHIPILLQSGIEVMSSLAETIKQFNASCIRKPYNREELVLMITRIMEKVPA